MTVNEFANYISDGAALSVKTGKYIKRRPLMQT